MIVALYAFCVVFPVAGFAFSSTATAPHCLTDVVQVEPVMHQHDEVQGHARHSDAHRSHDHAPMAMADATGLQDHAGMDHPGVTHNSGKPIAPACCGVMCVSALPASLFELAPRTVHHLSVTAFSDAGIPADAPDRLYRPPIVLLSL
ncbi:hypothetical protein BH10PSE10_BH10PSE10_18450 [soil metagenome]